MSYHLMVNFPKNRDNKGILKMYNDSGNLVFGPIEALGRGSNDIKNGNDHTQWNFQNADVPTGVYNITVVAAGSPTSSFGPYKRVWMSSAVSGNALIAQNNGRSEIMVHGGDLSTDSSATWYPLRPTYGCIRLSNNNQAALINAIATATGSGKITIS